MLCVEPSAEVCLGYRFHPLLDLPLSTCNVVNIEIPYALATQQESCNCPFVFVWLGGDWRDQWVASRQKVLTCSRKTGKWCGLKSENKDTKDREGSERERTVSWCNIKYRWHDICVCFIPQCANIGILLGFRQNFTFALQPFFHIKKSVDVFVLSGLRMKHVNHLYGLPYLKWRLS